jgi:hypothetical protein
MAYIILAIQKQVPVVIEKLQLVVTEGEKLSKDVIEIIKNAIVGAMKYYPAAVFLAQQAYEAGRAVEFICYISIYLLTFYFVR